MRNANFIRALSAAILLAFVPVAAPAQVSVGIGISIAPPAIPVYAQPPCPYPNYLWTPGYWAWGPGGYYWVAGTWIAPPAVGLLWTPGYWGWHGSAYYWHAGYWGHTVGFYGGINYGFGYFGAGYVGGAWYGNSFHYNTAVTNVNRTVIHNTYVNKTVINQDNHNHVSYNGGAHGTLAKPTAAQRQQRQQAHGATHAQLQHEQWASRNHNALANTNHGHPQTPAVSHPYSDTNHPPHYSPVTAQDRQSAQHYQMSMPHGGAAGHRPPL